MWFHLGLVCFVCSNWMLEILLPSQIFLSHFLSVISVVLWIGDLNYRISDLDVDIVKDLISKKNFESLHSHDQVVLTMILSFFDTFIVFIIVCLSGYTYQMHVDLSLRDRSIERLFLMALWRERLISSLPTNTTPALTNGIQGNLIWRLEFKS